MKTTFTTFLLTVITAVVFSQSPGSLDTSFGDNGIVLQDIQEWNDFFYDVSIQDDGKIIAAGRMESEEGSDRGVICRFNPDGTLDNTFGVDGCYRNHISSYDIFTCLYIQNDGRILFAGYSYSEETDVYYMVVGRLLETGELDPTFAGGNGWFAGVMELDKVFDITLDEEDQIICCGERANSIDIRNGAVACYDINGTVVPSFGSGGYTKVPDAYGNSSLNSLDIMQDGSIIAGGYMDGMDDSYLVIKLDNTGVFTPDFGMGAGVNWIPFDNSDDEKCTSVKVQSDGLILTSGYGYNTTYSDFDIYAARMDQNGFLDESFGYSGKNKFDVMSGSDYALSMEIQADDKIIMGGFTDCKGTYDMLLMRLTEDGKLCYDFGVSGSVIEDLGGNDQFQSIVIQEDGKVVAAGFNNQMSSGGQSDFALARYFTGIEVSVPESSELNSSTMVYPNPVSGVVNISCDVVIEDVSLFDLFGNNVFNRPVGEKAVSIDLCDLQQGVYYVRINSEFETFQEKVVVY